MSTFIVQALLGEGITIYFDDLFDVWLSPMGYTPDDFAEPVNIGNPDGTQDADAGTEGRLEPGLAKTIAFFDELLKSNRAVNGVGR